MASTSAAFDAYSRNDFVLLFRILNGMSMVHMLETLDALLKRKGFYPNPERYKAELRAAGIFVERVEIAMSAVLHKAAGKMPFQQFATVYGHILALLPEDQRHEIGKYYSGSFQTPGVIQDRVVKQYVEWAWSAVWQTTRLLPRGRANKAEDLLDGSLLAIYKARNQGSGSPYAKPEKVAEIAIAAKGGNCQEHSAVAYVCLKKMGVRPVHWYKLVNGDHAFVLIGRPGTIGLLDANDLRKFGSRMVVCDAWARDAYVATEIPRRLPGLSGSFKAMDYS
jgi:hypothetical protein